MIESIHRKMFGGLAAGLLIVVAGCGDEPSAPGGEQTDLTSAEAAEIADLFEDDADLSIGALFHGGTINAFGPMPTLMDRPGRHPRANPLECLLVEPMPPEDPDADGVPTLLTIRFEPDPCVFEVGRTALEFSGSITISDPIPDAAGYDINEVIDHFGIAHTLPNGRAIASERNGIRNVQHVTDANELRAQEMLTTRHTTPGRAFKEAGADWRLVFAGDDAVVFAQPLPGGSVTLEGTWSFRNQQHVRMFEVTTLTALKYDATCTDVRPILRFTEGEIQKTLIRNGAARAVIKLTWTGCGERPTREVMPVDGTS